MDQPLKAHSIREVEYYWKVTPCRNCGKGPLVPEDLPPSTQPGEIVDVSARCPSCSQTSAETFTCEHPQGESWPASEQINPTPHPSRLLGLSQWLSLFYALLEQAYHADESEDTRRIGLQAALCLEEALKFYPDDDDELPPASAMYTQAGRDALADQPGKFARQKLQAMRDRLPSVSAMTRRVARDHSPPAPRRWWQFWKR